MFLGYQNNKIVLTANTREELENNKFMTFDSIKETDVDYTLYGGEYLTDEQLAEKQKEAQKQELMAQLNTLDLKCIRSLRAIQSGKSTDADTVILADYEKEAEAIRKQLRDLGE